MLNINNYINELNARISQIINEYDLIDTGRLLDETKVIAINFNKETFDVSLELNTTEYAIYLLNGNFINTITNDTQIKNILTQILIDIIELDFKYIFGNETIQLKTKI